MAARNLKRKMPLAKLRNADDRKLTDTKRIEQEERQANIDALLVEAKAAGLQGKELAALMGQAAHESADFTTLTEIGKGKGRKYGGGKNFYGRGQFQLTHKENYKKYGNMPEIKKYIEDNYGEGVKLEKYPELVEKDKILAAKVSVAYWKTIVRPAVQKYAGGDFGDTYVVGAAINLPASLEKDPKAKVESAKEWGEQSEVYPERQAFVKGTGPKLTSLADVKRQSEYREMGRDRPGYVTPREVLGMKDRLEKTKKWAEKLGVEAPAAQSVTPMFEREQYQSQLPKRTVPATAAPMPAPTAPPAPASEDWEQYAQPEMTRVQVNGQTGEIPVDKLSKFLQDNPGATVLD